MIQGINHINLSVKDLEAAFNFYKDVLQFKALCRWPKGAYFLAGDLWFCLNLDPDHEPATGYTHLAFSILEEDFEDFAHRIEHHRVREWKDNTSEGNSLYILDPEGHRLELHVGDWQSRLMSKKQKPWPEAKFFV